MATTTLSFQKRARNSLRSPAWDSTYTSSTGSDLMGADYGYVVVYKFSPYTGSNVQTVNSINFTAKLEGDTGQSCSYTLALYSTDPSGGNTRPSSGVLASTSASTSTGTISWGISPSFASYSTLYVTIEVNYYSGQVSLSHGTSSIVENYTARALPQISFGTFVNTDTGFTIPINNGNNYTLTCVITAGNTTTPGNNAELYRSTSSNGRFEVPVTAVTWFDTAGITNSLYIPVTIKVTGGNPSQLTGQGTYQESRTSAINSMRPTVSIDDPEIVQPPGFPNDYASTYIAGFSKCMLTAVITRPTDALVSTVTLSYPGGRTVTMTPVSGSTDTYEGTTFSALATDTTFTITVTDERGLSNTGTESVTGVVPYVLPSVSIDPANTYRCNSQGVKTDGGDHYKIRVTPQISTIIIDSDTGNDTNYITELTVGLKSIPDDDPPGRYPIPTNGNISDTLPPVSATAANTLPQPKQAYVLTVIIQDRISGQVIREYTLKGLQRDLVLNHDGGHTHLGVGMTPIGKDISGYKDTIELPSDGLFLLGGIPAQAFNYPHIAGGTSADPCFGHDFLNVAADRTGEANAAAIFGFPASDYSSWSNLPDDPLDQQSPPTGIKTLGWMGWREVYFANQDVCLVKITEMAPKIGRVWFCSRGRNATTHEYEWSLWSYLMPTAVPYADNS